MTLLQRLLYALAFVAVANAIGLLILGIASPDGVRAVVGEMHWLVFVEIAIAFALAPALSRYLPRKRDSA